MEHTIFYQIDGGSLGYSALLPTCSAVAGMSVNLYGSCCVRMLSSFHRGCISGTAGGLSAHIPSSCRPLTANISLFMRGVSQEYMPPLYLSGKQKLYFGDTGAVDQLRQRDITSMVTTDIISCSNVQTCRSERFRNQIEFVISKACIYPYIFSEDALYMPSKLEQTSITVLSFTIR